MGNAVVLVGILFEIAAEAGDYKIVFRDDKQFLSTETATEIIAFLIDEKSRNSCMGRQPPLEAVMMSLTCIDPGCRGKSGALQCTGK